MQTYNSFLKYKLHASKQRPWNFEIPVTFFHSDNREFNFVMSFPSKPTVEEIQAAIDLWVQRIDTSDDRVPEFNFVMSFPSKPTVEEIQAAIDLWVQEIGADEQEEGIPPKSEEMKE